MNSLIIEQLLTSQVCLHDLADCKVQDSTGAFSIINAEIVDPFMSLQSPWEQLLSGSSAES